jgi:hypothetical protein
VSFTREHAIKSVRKARRCDGCGVRINVGEPAMGWAGLTDGDFGTATYHPECRNAEVALNGLHDWFPGDDWIPLSDCDGEDRPWLAAEHPVVAARMGIAARLPSQTEEY